MFNGKDFKEKFINLVKNIQGEGFDVETLIALNDSVYYYCAGKDPTPIFALNDRHSVFVYADIIGYGHGDYFEETEHLYRRLIKKGYTLLYKIPLQSLGGFAIKNATATLWQNGNKNFALIYLQGDAGAMFNSLYNEVLPKCIVNIRYEFNGRQGQLSRLKNCENEVDFVMGYCFNSEYRIVEEFDYYGDYGEKRIKFFSKTNMFDDYD